MGVQLMSRIISKPMLPHAKGKGKKKSKVKKKACGPKCLHCKKKAIRLWSDAVRLRDGKCLICGKVGLPRKKDGLYMTGLESHHLIGKGNCNFRNDMMNGITLCHYHHQCDSLICAHGSNDAVMRFMEWLESTEHYNWFMDNRDYRHTANPNYGQDCIDLQAYIEKFKRKV
jgi:hypothetical protein